MEEMSKVSQTGKALNGLRRSPGGGGRDGVQPGVGQEPQGGCKVCRDDRIQNERAEVLIVIFLLPDNYTQKEAVDRENLSSDFCSIAYTCDAWVSSPSLPSRRLAR